MQRLILAVSLFGPAAAASYAIQRLLDAQGEPTGILLTTHIPYYWRAGMAGLHGLAIAILLASLVRQPAYWLRYLPITTVVIVGLSALAMSVRP
ncbi:MAG: hypothetical protein P8R54_17710 [Myxococcota bacterium]|nr:hypothetical protein [Myxococcota bacterium]